MKITIFPGKYHQNGGFSMAMLVSGSVVELLVELVDMCFPLSCCFFIDGGCRPIGNLT